MTLSMRFNGVVALVVLGFIGSVAQGAAPPPQVFNFDLEPGIKRSASRPERFAVDVPFAANTASHGIWTRAKGVSTWHYAIRIPTAVSMSFRATSFKLPANAALLVSAGGSSASYKSGDASPSGLFSRVMRGDTLTLDLQVATPLESQVDLQIASLQAGYRGLGGGVADHPYFKKLHAITANADSPCVENFSCHENAGNFGPRNATAAIVISGVAQCTGTLVNNVRGDLRPYLLTARHCQSGIYTNDSVSVYWEAVAPCNAALASIYDTTTPVYTGGGTYTVFEQQDVWLLDLGLDLPQAHVYFAGWDATGGTFVGGYSPHHALGRSRQFASWFGQPVLHEIADSALGSGYRGKFWGVVNETGSIGSGASGGGLFDANNRLVGSASLALLPTGEGDGVCPVASPPAPTLANVVAEYNALSAVWDTTEDTTSSTNPRTLKSILDPDDTGTKVLDGFELLRGASVYTVSSSVFSDSPINISWTAPVSGGCTAEGGRPGDGWAGPIAKSGNVNVQEDFEGDVTYAIRCLEGSRVAFAKTTVHWYQLPPQTNLFVNPAYDVYAGQSRRFDWRANVQPCTASGGSAGDGWAGPKTKVGTQDIVMNTLGAITYTLTCGTGARVASYSYTMNTLPPFAYLYSYGNVDNLRIGQSLRLLPTGTGTCVRSGGSAGDGWSTSTADEPLVTATVAGTYTYTVTCTAGGQSAIASIVRTFNNTAAFATLVPASNNPETANSGQGGDLSQGNGVDIQWNSNLPECALNYTGPANTSGRVGFGQFFNSGTAHDWQYVAGRYTYTLVCTGGSQTVTTTATVDWVALHPWITLYVPATLTAHQGSGVAWNSNLYPCTGSGGAAGDGWAGPKASAQGTTVVVENQPGSYEFRIDCTLGIQGVAQVGTGVVPQPAVTVTPFNAHVQVGYGATIEWSATTSPCVLTSDNFNRDWTGSQYAYGRANVYETTPGLHTYTATCGSAGNTVSASGQVTFDPSPFPSSTLSANKTTVAVNEPVVLSWTSSNTDYCTPSADTSNISDWIGPIALSGSKTVTRPIPGNVTYRLSCNGAFMKEVVVQYTGVIGAPNPFDPPTLTFSANQTQRTTGQMVTLTWSSTHASSCTAFGGSATDGWAGSISLAGSQTFTEAVAGNYLFQIVCEGAPPSIQKDATVSFFDPVPVSTGGGGSSSGGGGGGRIDWLLIALLGSLATARTAMRRARQQ